MKASVKNIEIGLGIGPLVFGQTRDQVFHLLGEPSEKERYRIAATGAEDTETWHYDALEMSLSFDREDDWTLSSIAVSDAHYILNAHALIGKELGEVMDIFRENQWGELIEDEEISQDEENACLIFVPEAGISLWFESQVLTELQISRITETDDEEC